MINKDLDQVHAMPVKFEKGNQIVTDQLFVHDIGTNDAGRS